MVNERNRSRFERICDDLVVLKDTSELMMNLAYSALLLNSRELAEEVQLLEDKVDGLHTEFELQVLSSLSDHEDLRGLLGLIRMGVVTERIADAAAEIFPQPPWKKMIVLGAPPWSSSCSNHCPMGDSRTSIPVNISWRTLHSVFAEIMTTTSPIP